MKGFIPGMKVCGNPLNCFHGANRNDARQCARIQILTTENLGESARIRALPPPSTLRDQLPARAHFGFAVEIDFSEARA